MKKTEKSKFWLLVLIFLIATILRIWRFNQIPKALFGDEIDTGYQAWSILKTGRDYFGNFLPIHFQSLGDWRMPLYIYLTTPFIFFLGLTETAVRLPSLIYSLASIIIFYFLIKEIINNEKIALLSCLFMALSSWHFHFSRIALEVTLFNFLFLTGLWLFLKSLQKKKNLLLIISAIIFSLSMYAYSTAKLFVPLLLVFLLPLFAKEFRPKKRILLFLIPFLVLILPIGWEIVFGQGSLRFGNISIFSSPTVAERVILTRQECSWSGIVERAIHNKLWVYLDDFVNNYLKSFSIDYLFIRGDPNLRHNPQERGQLYLIFLPLIIFGIWGLGKSIFKDKDKKYLLPILIILLTPIPAALTQAGGTHAIRTFQFLPWWLFLAALGMIFVLEQIKNNFFKKIFLVFVFLILFLNCFSFFHFYFSHFPNKEGSWWRWWNYGYREVFDYINKYETDYQQIYLTPAYEPPAIYALFYNHYPPKNIQKEIEISINHFGKFIFANPDLAFLKTKQKQEKILFMVSPGYVQAMGYNLKNYPNIEILKEINYPGEETVFTIFRTR